jgi:peptidoglycan hydrolase CwlO-like protein
VSAAVPVPASAHLAGDLELAKRRVAELEDRITKEEAAVQSLGTQLKSLAASVGREQGGLDSVQRELSTTRARIQQTKAELQALRDRLRARARSVYMRGPLEMVGVLLGSQTVREFLSRVGYAAKLADHDGQLVYQARAAQSKLKEQQVRQEQLEREQRSKVTTLRAQQSRITNLFARQMATMAELAQFRGEALHLVSEIEGRIARGEVDGLRRVAGRGMTISYGAWAGSFLTALGAPSSRDNLVAVIAWQAAEGTMATWNPLATTKAMPGATVYNSHGVKNYRSKEQGIEASIMTLRLPNRGYEPIIASLRASAEAMETGRAINRSLWCRGCAGGSYVIGFIPAVEQYYDRYAN